MKQRRPQHTPTETTNKKKITSAHAVKKVIAHNTHNRKAVESEGLLTAFARRPDSNRGKKQQKSECTGPVKDPVKYPCLPFSVVLQGSIYPTGTRFHIPDLSLISGSLDDKASVFNLVPGPRYAGNLSRKPRLPSLSPCTGSRLPGLTRQGGKHTLQRPKVRYSAPPQRVSLASRETSPQEGPV